MGKIIFKCEYKLTCFFSAKGERVLPFILSFLSILHFWYIFIIIWPEHKVEVLRAKNIHLASKISVRLRRRWKWQARRRMQCAVLS